MQILEFPSMVNSKYISQIKDKLVVETHGVVRKLPFSFFRVDTIPNGTVCDYGMQRDTYLENRRTIRDEIYREMLVERNQSAVMEWRRVDDNVKVFDQGILAILKLEIPDGVLEEVNL